MTEFKYEHIMSFKSIACLLCMIASSLCCTIADGWQPSNLREQAAFAGAIIEGTVKLTETKLQNQIIIQKTVYHKGCGPSEVTIKGFTDNGACGIITPSPGRRALFFVCMSDTADEWVLNTYTPFAGSLSNADINLNELKIVTINEYKCKSGGFLYKGCNKRANSQINVFIDKTEAVTQPNKKEVVVAKPVIKDDVKNNVTTQAFNRQIIPSPPTYTNYKNISADTNVILPSPSEPKLANNITVDSETNSVNNNNDKQNSTLYTEAVNGIDASSYEQLKDTYTRYYQQQYPSYYFASTPVTLNGSTSY